MLQPPATFPTLPQQKSTEHHHEGLHYCLYSAGFGRLSLWSSPTSHWLWLQPVKSSNVHFRSCQTSNQTCHYCCRKSLTIYDQVLRCLTNIQLHPCGGTASQWYGGTRLPAQSENLGFILIYPQTQKNSNCWDVNNAATLTHGAGGDSLGVISMVNYTLSKYNADPAKVFVMGGSSGAMMANVMVGSYPEVFEAGAAYSGVAFACFAGAPEVCHRILLQR